MMEPGRRALADVALLQQVAGMIGDAENMRLTTVGAVSISQLAGEWTAGERSDFARLMTSSGTVWPPEH
jgi:hypothetical protein